MSILKNAPKPILGSLLAEILRNECSNKEFNLLIIALKLELLK